MVEYDKDGEVEREIVRASNAASWLIAIIGAAFVLWAIF